MLESLDSHQRGDRAALDLESIRDWLYLHKRAAVAITTTTILLVVVLGLAVLGRAAPRTPIELSLPRAAAAPPVAIASPVVVAHVSGAVRDPGVFRAPPGSRVADLVDAAGGLISKADPDRVNLAAVVRDGDKIHIPEVDEVIVEVDGSGPGPVDLNRADSAELESLPGIGPSLASAIVEHRDKHGRFSSVNGLEKVSGIGPATIDRLRDLATV